MFIELSLVLTGVLIVVLVYLLRSAEIVKRYSSENILFENNTIDFDSLTIRQRLAQMFIVHSIIVPKSIGQLNVGGVYFNVEKGKEEYRKMIMEYQKRSKITLFIATDLEGYWNPFVKFYRSKFVSEIKNNKEAYELGIEHGRILKELGFNMNFAPIVELEDKIWKERCFSGNVLEIGGKVDSYIEGLQSYGIIGCAKHYPGGSLNVKDPHRYTVEAEISGKDVELFESAIKSKVAAIMIGNVVVSGEVDSKKMPCVVNKDCIKKLRKKFKGLIVTDEVNMKGLMNFYSDKTEMYSDLINAGNDLIIDFRLTVNSLDRILRKLEKRVRNRDINEERINETVKRILKYKRIKIKK